MNKLKIKGVYKHFKGNYYILEDIGKSADDESEYVIYRALYGDNTLWIRKKDEFLSEVDKVKYPYTIQKYRFELVDKIK